MSGSGVLAFCGGAAFEGNDDLGSIGCNLLDHPGPAHFYEVLRSIRDRSEVHGVWVGITEVMAPEDVDLVAAHKRLNIAAITK